MNKNCSYKLIAKILLIVILTITLTAAFSGANYWTINIKNWMLVEHSPLDNTAMQVVGLNPTKAPKLRLEERFSESLINWRFFDVWLYSQMSIKVFCGILYKYLFVFLMFVSFLLITITWKQDKDGKKRCLIAKKL